MICAFNLILTLWLVRYVYLLYVPMYRCQVCTDFSLFPFSSICIFIFCKLFVCKKTKKRKTETQEKKRRIIAKCISAKLKTHFSLKENLKKCSSFEELEGTRYIRGNVCFDIKVFSSLYSTKPCLGFLLICFVREIKYFYQIL